jgi:hypothetical protein
MDYLAVFKAKIARLRVEIADIQDLNQRLRRDGGRAAVVQLVKRKRSA